MTRSSWFHYIILFLGILCISWSAIFVKLADVSGLSSAFYRMFIGFIGVLPIWLIRKKQVSDKKSVLIAVLCGAIFACDIAVWNISILLTKAAISTLIANLAPVWVGIGAILFLKEKPGRIFWIGTAIALFGVSVIVGIDKIYNSRLNAGHFLAILASLFYACYRLSVAAVRDCGLRHCQATPKFMRGRMLEYHGNPYCPLHFVMWRYSVHSQFL